MSRKQSEIDRMTMVLMSEIKRDGARIAEAMFGNSSPGAQRLPRMDFIEHFRRNWDTPPTPEWRVAFLDRMAPELPGGGRSEVGLKAFNALLRDAFPNGRAPDPTPPPQSDMPTMPPDQAPMQQAMPEPPQPQPPNLPPQVQESGSSIPPPEMDQEYGIIDQAPGQPMP